MPPVSRAQVKCLGGFADPRLVRRGLNDGARFTGWKIARAPQVRATDSLLCRAASLLPAIASARKPLYAFERWSCRGLIPKVASVFPERTMPALTLG